jgi:hypothetical protein
MSWLEPKKIPAGGTVRVVRRLHAHDTEEGAKVRELELRKAYHRAYYHARRKGKRKQTYTPEQLERRREQRAQAYRRNLERERANARARYWKNRDAYAAASKERQRARRAA